MFTLSCVLASGVAILPLNQVNIQINQALSTQLVFSAICVTKNILECSLKELAIVGLFKSEAPRTTEQSRRPIKP